MYRYIGSKAKQQSDFPLALGNKFYFYANIFYCSVPPTWPAVSLRASSLFGLVMRGYSEQQENWGKSPLHQSSHG